MFIRFLRGTAQSILVLVFLSPVLLAQSNEGILRGQITDPSGAAVPALTVTVTDAAGTAKEVQTDDQGRYAFPALPAGTYTLRVSLKGFADVEKPGIVVAPGQPAVVNVQLQIVMEKEQVNVNDTASGLNVAAENNASALVIRGKDLQSLSDDPDDLQAELQALAGPAAGPNGGQIYIDGFTGGQLPAKSAILEIRVNQNPFSAVYDKLGYGRIEITTKPAASHFHGQVFASGTSSAVNSRNPFLARQPASHSDYLDANLGSPLGKKASFFVYGYIREVKETSNVSAIVLDPALAQVPFNQALIQPQSRKYLGPRLDYQLGANNVLSIRYEYQHDSRNNLGTGQFALPSQAYNLLGTFHSLEMNDTQVASPRTVNQTQFRYWHFDRDQSSASLLPAINVLGAFTGGGNILGTNLDTQNNYELRNLTSISSGRHMVVFGGRLRDAIEASNSTGGFNGTFTFPSITAYQITQQGLQQAWTADQIRAAGGGASQFSITGGRPYAQVNLVDLGLYAEDQWRLRPNISLNLGLRFETQNNIHDHADFAPRVALAWGLGGGKNPKTVLRAGAGVFYDRFPQAELLQADRLNGTIQQQFVVIAPDFFPDIPPLGLLANSQSLPTLYRIDQSLKSPYLIQVAVGVERQITRNITASVTYLDSHGVHQLLARNINTPLPGTFNLADRTSGVRPYSDLGNVFQYESDGLFNQNQLITNYNVRMGKRLSVYGYYTLSYADSNTSGPESFPMNPYDLRADYGRAGFDVRHRFLMGGSFGLPRGFGISPFVMANSGTPFNITLGQDLLGTSIFNGRPALAAPGATGPGIVATPFGTFDTQPSAGEALLPPYYGAGPGQFVFNLRLVKTFGIGKKGGQGHAPAGGGWYTPKAKGLGGRGLSGGTGSGGGESQPARFNLELGITARNIFNIVNFGTPVGNLTSPYFGRSNSLAPSPYSSLGSPRRLDLQVRFLF